MGLPAKITSDLVSDGNVKRHYDNSVYNNFSYDDQNRIIEAYNANVGSYDYVYDRGPLDAGASPNTKGWARATTPPSRPMPARTAATAMTAVFR